MQPNWPFVNDKRVSIDENTLLIACIIEKMSDVNFLSL